MINLQENRISCSSVLNFTDLCEKTSKSKILKEDVHDLTAYKYSIIYNYGFKRGMNGDTNKSKAKSNKRML